MGEHTPGPWINVPSSRGGEYVETKYPVGSKEKQLIRSPGSGGATSYTTKVCQLNGYGTPEWKANARLIAAAPEMLAALKATLANWVDLAESGDAGFWEYEKEEHVIAARAAIAKAEGLE